MYVHSYWTVPIARQLEGAREGPRAACEGDVWPDRQVMYVSFVYNLIPYTSDANLCYRCTCL
jgi:hypothetical protein